MSRYPLPVVNARARRTFHPTGRRHITVSDQWTRLQRRQPELAEWRLVVNGRMTSAAGRCKYRRREIHIARWHVDGSPEAEVLDTLLHEAAHALAGPDAHHGPRWKEWARALGADPTRTLPHEVWRKSPSGQRPPRWLAVCRRCGQEYRRKRRPRKRRLVCGCGGELEWRSA